MVLMNAGVQARLRTVDTRAKLAPELATRDERHNRSLHST
jgi:hypothetical protein